MSWTNYAHDFISQFAYKHPMGWVDYLRFHFFSEAYRSERWDFDFGWTKKKSCFMDRMIVGLSSAMCIFLKERLGEELQRRK